VTVLSDAAVQGGVRKLAIVDDAYDPPAGREISENAYNRFVTALEDSPTLLEYLAPLSRLRAEHLEDWERFTEEEALIQALWEVHLRDSTDSEVAAAAHGALDTLFDEIRTDRISKLQQLKPLEDLLSETSASLLKLGADSAPEVVAHVDVVFLDLYLSGEVGPPQEGVNLPRVRSIARGKGLPGISRLFAV